MQKKTVRRRLAFIVLGIALMVIYLFVPKGVSLYQFATALLAQRDLKSRFILFNQA